jgi:hypothetical protein
MMDYSVIVYGQPTFLRENRLFLFEIIYHDDIEEVNFKNSFLEQRYGYPLKAHNFYTGPFSHSLEEKIAEQDKKDVQELLIKQLNAITKETCCAFRKNKR